MNKKLKILIIILAVGVVSAAGWWIWRSQLTKECATDLDCPKDYWCWVGICSPPLPGGPADCERDLCIKKCESDIDCGSEKVCKLVKLFRGDVGIGTKKGCVEPDFPYSEEMPAEVTIATDKTEYEQGETVEITIRNDLDKEKWIYLPFYTIERFDNDNWIEIKKVNCPCEVTCKIAAYFILQPHGVKEHQWDQKETWCSDPTRISKTISKQVPFGKYRIKSEISDIDDYKSKQTIYSNEFTIREKEVKNEIITLEDVKQRIKDIDWQLSLTAEDQNKTINFLIGGPYFYKESIEEHTHDNMIILGAENYSYSIDGGQTWIKSDEGLPVLWFIENNKEKEYPFLGEKGRCDIIDYNGQETMVVFLSGAGFAQYYKTINGRKIFSGYDSTEGHYFIWCNKQNTLQMVTMSRDISFAESIIDKYFETF